MSFEESVIFFANLNYRIFKVRNKNIYIVGAVIFEVIEANRRRSMDKRLGIWV